jgi:hypothetical protein
MPASEKNGGHFEVHCSGANARALKQIQKRAKKEGRGEEVLAAITHLLHRLAK